MEVRKSEDPLASRPVPLEHTSEAGVSVDLMDDSIKVPCISQLLPQ